ncbi:MAG TPA: hypothetical protein G4N98_09635 [Thermoflexia bacterium]|nr:hypothetical protein [Thermoflexia bacterium]
MAIVERIQAEINTLTPEEYGYFRQWFWARDWQRWERQFERDAASGKLDFLLEEAFAEKAQGQLREIRLPVSRLAQR